MNFESITETELMQMENASSTHDETYYLETIEKLNNLEIKLDNIYKQLCELGSQIGNTYTILNDFNKNAF